MSAGKLGRCCYAVPLNSAQHDPACNGPNCATYLKVGHIEEYVYVTQEALCYSTSSTPQIQNVMMRHTHIYLASVARHSDENAMQYYILLLFTSLAAFS